MPRKVRPLLACVLAAALVAPVYATDTLEEIVVTGQLRAQPLATLAASVSVLPGELIERRHGEHLEDILAAAPNVNFNAGASRGRFVQLRGIGERSQFVDPVDPSVGLFIDGIDFSGLGNAGTLFDIEQVEILRGPQGTAFGASAMGGLVNMRSAAPTATPRVALRGGGAQYGGQTVGLSASGPLAPTLGGRIAIERHRGDGFIENDYLGSDDTNVIDESTARARIRWRPDDALELGLGLVAVDADNGYDAFSLDNTRHTLSDQPGRDRQRSTALVADARWSGWDSAALELSATTSRSDLDYGYDEDWSYPGLCTGTPCEGWEYASTDRYLRDVHASSLDLRLLSTGDEPLGWVAGLYFTQRDTELERRYGTPPFFHSDYQHTRGAAYGELRWSARPALELVAGLRAERIEGDYEDTLGVAAAPRETQLGVQLSARYRIDDAAMLYALVSRGYKPGGVNGEARGKVEQTCADPAAGYCFGDEVRSFLAEHTEYGSESLWNHELGYKRNFDRGSLRAALFLMEREDVQVKAWYNDGPSFVGYTDTAGRGRNHGAEFELALEPADTVSLDASLGLLETDIEDFAVDNPDTPAFDPADRGGREQAQAPHWQFHAAAEWAFATRWYLRADYEGKDAAYFSDSDPQRSDAYRLLHVVTGWRGERLEISAWVRNALDEDYAVHGFYFGNDPRKFYSNESYVQWGTPRVIGLSVGWTLGE